MNKKIKDLIIDEMISPIVGKIIWKEAQKEERKSLAEYIKFNNLIEPEYKKILIKHLELIDNQ